MKRILLFVVVLLGSIVAGAQENNIYILPFQPSIDGIPEEARSYLESKMENIIVNYGIASGGLSQHFVITSKVKVIERDIAPTTPIRISQKFEITMQIGDAVKNQVFSSCTMNVAGIGTTETKACIQAFQNINVNNPQFKELISVAKDRIIAYYNSNCDLLIQEAEQQIYRQQYDEAIAALIAIPSACPDCYQRCQNLAAKAYDESIDLQGKQLIQKAKAAWNSKMDYEAASNALSYLAQVNPQAACFEDANKMVQSISSKLRADELAKWEFKVQQAQNAFELQQQRVAAIQAIGVAIGGKFGPLIKIKRSIF